MSFSPELAEIRFGCGVSPNVPAPSDPLALLFGLSQPDEMAVRFPISGFDSVRSRIVEVAKLRVQSRNSADKAEYKAKIKILRQEASQQGNRWLVQTLQRWVHTKAGFHERLVAF